MTRMTRGLFILTDKNNAIQFNRQLRAREDNYTKGLIINILVITFIEFDQIRCFICVDHLY